MPRRFLTPPQLPSGTSLPSAGAAGALFFKSDEAKIYVHNGTTWVVAQGSGGGGGVIVSATAPSSPSEGTYWFDSTTAKSYIYYDNFWVEVGDNSGGYIVASTAPANPSAGDVWFNTVENAIYVYYGTAWVDPVKGSEAAVPAGGTTGQILAKVSDSDYDTQWIAEAPAASFTSTVKHQVKLGASIAKGQAVYVTSADGNNMIVSKASNDGEATSSKTMGLLETGGVTNALVNVITEGMISGLDTSAAGVAGAPVYLGTNGNLVYGLANMPLAPANLVAIGFVTRVHANQGKIFVKVQNGFELDELHNVSITNETDGEILQYNATSGLWVNGPRPITSTMDGGDPTSTYAGAAIDGGDASSF